MFPDPWIRPEVPLFLFNSGYVPLFPGTPKRPSQVRDEERSKKRNTWFAKGDVETVLFVDATTPRSELAKECRKIMKEPS